MKNVVLALLCAGLAACATAPRPSAPAVATVVAAPAVAPSRCAGVVYAPAQEDLSKRGDYVAGGLFRPGERDSIPTAVPDVECIPEPQVVALERSKLGNRPVYSVLDRQYRVLDDTRGYAEEGLASYYGQKFHGRRTSNWEVYDMYAFTAAHKTLPLPSFARVTNLANGRSVVVRVNDRGPFHDGRVVDLSYAAAVKLGVYPAGTGRVRVEALQPGDAAPVLAQSGPAPAAAAEYRFDMGQPGANASADDFDAWMKRNQVRVATGRATTLPADVGTPDVRAEPLVAPVAATAPVAVLPASPVMLQVASFSARDNAERALAVLQRAGIGEARLHDAIANGLPVWRLRIGPLAAASESDLLARLAGLGFGSARRVRD
jgi:rare lipoprotein A